MAAQPNNPDIALANAMLACYADPVRFVRVAYPWGEPGPLAQMDGPDTWQRELLEHIGDEVRARRFDGINAVPAIREAVSSGHGIGKSVLVAWLVNWIMSTRPGAHGTVTANTWTQLETKTWAAIEYWTKLSITAHWFKFGDMVMRCVFDPKNWYCEAQSCKEENSEAFAGQHAATSTSFYLFDEASAISDKIFEVAEGGLTDGEPMEFCFGNPTRNSGKFYRVCFGSERARWNSRSIDSRTAKFTNKAQIEEWIQDYGEDSDFVRVRVRGLPPSQGDLQFIDSERVYAAQRRAPQALSDDPLICGLDVSRGGSDWTVFRFRRGFDAQSVPSIKIPGEQVRDTSVLVSRAAEVLSDRRPERKVSYMFVDSAFGGPVVNRLQQMGFRNVSEINFGGASPDAHQANMRAYMWSRLKDWLLQGAIDKDATLETDLTGPGYRHDRHDKLVLESKEDMAKRGLASPDHGDALALTFARHVAPVQTIRQESSASYHGPHSVSDYGWMG